MCLVKQGVCVCVSVDGRGTPRRDTPYCRRSWAPDSYTWRSTAPTSCRFRGTSRSAPAPRPEGTYTHIRSPNLSCPSVTLSAIQYSTVWLQNAVDQHCRLDHGSATHRVRRTAHLRQVQLLRSYTQRGKQLCTLFL